MLNIASYFLSSVRLKIVLQIMKETYYSKAETDADASLVMLDETLIELG